MVRDNFESYNTVHKEFVRIADTSKKCEVPKKDNPTKSTFYLKRGHDTSLRRAYASLLVLHYVFGKIPPLKGKERDRMRHFLTTDTQREKARELVRQFRENETSPEVLTRTPNYKKNDKPNDSAETLYERDIEHYVTDYNQKQGITRFKGLHQIAGFWYWRHSEKFDKMPQHSNTEYKAFFELFGDKIPDPEAIES